VPLKKSLMLFISAILMVSFFTIIAFANSTIKLIVNGSEIKPDVPPQIINGRTMVPIKWVAETLAFEIDLTVEPERYPDGSAVSSRYFITKLDWIKGKTEFIPNY